MPLREQVEARCRIAMQEIFGAGATIAVTVSGDRVSVTVTNANITDHEVVSLGRRCPQEDADRLLESDPTCIQLAKSRGLTPAQFLAWLRKEEHADGMKQVLRRVRMYGEESA